MSSFMLSLAILGGLSVSNHESALNLGVHNIKIKTVYANENQIVAMFFPSPIRQAIVGNDAFSFSYNRTNPQHLGILQATSGQPSNLLVITIDGQIYSYHLLYNKNLSVLTYFIPIADSIGKEDGGNASLSIENINLYKSMIYTK